MALTFPTGIVVHDPNRPRYLDGTVVPGRQQVERVRGEGTLVLPYDDDRVDGLGYARRGWGQGVQVDAPGGGSEVCPMAIRLVPDREWLYWCAVFTNLTNAAQSVRVRPVLERHVAVTRVVDLQNVALAEVRPGKEQVFAGRVGVYAVEPVVVGVRFKVAGEGVRVLVTAVSQSRVDAAYP